MTDERMALIELIEKQADTDPVREMLWEPVAQRSFDPVDRRKADKGRRLAFAADRIMDLEVELRTGATKGARSPMREVQRNGYRERDWVEEEQETVRWTVFPTTAGGADCAGDPETAQGRAFGTLPSFPEPRRTAEKALVALDHCS